MGHCSATHNTGTRYCSRLKSVASSATHMGGVLTYGGPVLHIWGHPNINGGIKTYGWYPNTWWPSATHMGESKHTGGCSKHMGTSKHTGASKHKGASKPTGGCPNIWGASKHWGV